MAEIIHAVDVQGLTFQYPGQEPFISDLSLDLKSGSRCLLIGANGAGKSTLLRIFAGKHMVGGRTVVRVLGRSAFHDTLLTCDGTLGYLGGTWSRNVGAAGEVSLQGDFSAEHMIFGVADVDPERRQKLIELLDIDLRWRMHKVSDGQRRRVQICMGLLRPFQVMLLDEITVDLDVVARMDLLGFLKEECEERGATIIYATHIFDGLEKWATQIAYVEEGHMEKLAGISEFLPKASDDDPIWLKFSLVQVVEPWLRKERDERIAREKSTTKVPVKSTSLSPFGFGSRHMAYYR